MSDVNGWENHSTWLYNLWLSNDQGAVEYWNEQAAEVMEEAEATQYQSKKEAATRTLADLLIQQAESDAAEWLPDQASFYADAINNALSSVSWREIAAALIDGVDN